MTINKNHNRRGARTVLVVEDDQGTVAIIRSCLTKEGIKVVWGPNGEKALVLAKKLKPDLVLLDIVLPKMDGFEFFRALRKESEAPIIFLTSKTSETDRVVGLKFGADDYISKPFSPKELAARVEIALRRTEIPAASNNRGPLKIGKITCDIERREIHVGSKPISCTAKEFECLRVLIEANGKVLSRDNLLTRIWGYDDSLDIDTRTVDQHIARLRRKLGSDGRRIVTVSGIGYKIHEE